MNQIMNQSMNQSMNQPISPKKQIGMMKISLIKY